MKPPDVLCYALSEATIPSSELRLPVTLPMPVSENVIGAFTPVSNSSVLSVLVVEPEGASEIPIGEGGIGGSVGAIDAGGRGGTTLGTALIVAVVVTSEII